MPTEERARLRSVLADGELTIPGRKGTWQQGAIRSLWIDIAGPRLHHYTQIIDGKVSRLPQIRGAGTIQKDKLALAGWGDHCRTLPVIMKAAPEPEDGVADPGWRAVIGFTPGDWEFKSTDEWFCEVWIPKPDFDHMVAAYRSGELKSCALGLETDLWTAAGDEYTPIGYGVTWYMVPPEQESIFPNAGLGTVVGLEWNDGDLAPSADEPDDVPALQPEASQLTTGVDAAAVAASVERLRRAVLHVGLLIAGAVAVLWFA